MVDTAKIMGVCLLWLLAPLALASDRYDDLIHQQAGRTGMPAPLIKAMIRAESGFRHRATSPRGAMGLMQLMPATAARFGTDDAYDPAQNIRGGTNYLAWLYRHFGGDWIKVIAAYNAGEGAVAKYGGVPPYKETREYVNRVLRFYQQYRPPPPDTIASTKQPAAPAPPVLKTAKRTAGPPRAMAMAPSPDTPAAARPTPPAPVATRSTPPAPAPAQPVLTTTEKTVEPPRAMAMAPASARPAPAIPPDTVPVHPIRLATPVVPQRLEATPDGTVPPATIETRLLQAALQADSPIVWEPPPGYYP
ncbi:MAG: lytic transglycosylase domain-containing protein [Thiothrix sp.]|nr:lytic transglycosylase domain-containing protein [Thiothrix sp.]